MSDVGLMIQYRDWRNALDTYYYPVLYEIKFIYFTELDYENTDLTHDVTASVLRHILHQREVRDYAICFFKTYQEIWEGS